jgi:4-amino-4-deoxy-L-arabinose transferase-like glycosyltransferase
MHMAASQRELASRASSAQVLGWLEPAALALIFATFAYAVSIGLTDRFGAVYGHDGYAGAHWALMAKNHVRYGLGVTKGYSLMNCGYPLVGRPRPYLQQPPGSILLIALAFWMLGQHEWVARLMSVLFSLGTLVFVYLIGRRLCGRWAGVLAAAAFAATPMELGYGRVPMQMGYGLFFMAAAVHSYARWIERPTRARGALVLGMVALGEICAWEACYTSFFLWLHHLFWPPGGKRNWRWLVWLAATALGAFTLVLSHILAHPLGFQCLKQRFLWRSAPGPGWQFTNWQLLRLEYQRCLEIFTLPLCVLSIAWCAILIWRLAKRKAQPNESLPLIFLATTATYVGIFRQGAWIHDISLYYGSPFFALAAGVLLAAVAGRLARRQWALAGLLVAGISAWTLPWTIAGNAALRLPRGRDGQVLLKTLHRRAPPDAVAGFCTSPEFAVVYYLDLPYVPLDADIARWPDCVASLAERRMPDLVLMATDCDWPREATAKAAGMRLWSHYPFGCDVLVGPRVRVAD